MHFSAIPTFVICTLAFAMTVAATFSPEWLVIYRLNEVYGTAGLVRICAGEKCVLAGKQLLTTHGLKAVFVFCIFAFILYFLSVIFCGLGLAKRWRKYFRLGGVCAILGALMSIIATSIYTLENPLSEAPDGFTYLYGFSYAFSWLGAILGLIGGILTIVFHRPKPNVQAPITPRSLKRRFMSSSLTSSSESHVTHEGKKQMPVV